MDDLLDKTTGKASVGDVVNKFESRGFGPLLLLPALIALLPTGAIPGVPSICGVTLCIICLQMAFGDEHPWLPAVLKNRSLIQKAGKCSRKVQTLRSKSRRNTHSKINGAHSKPGVAFCCCLLRAICSEYDPTGSGAFCSCSAGLLHNPHRSGNDEQRWRSVAGRHTMPGGHRHDTAPGALAGFKIGYQQAKLLRLLRHTGSRAYRILCSLLGIGR